MNKTKPLIGILPTPYIENNISNKIFLKENIIKFLKENSLDYIIIPYTINKVELNNILPKLNGLVFPGSQLGNYFNNKFIKHYYLKQKYIVKQVKLLAHNNNSIPILSICHGHQSMVLIEKNYKLTNKNIKKTLLNVHSYSDSYSDSEYKTIPKFKRTKLGNLFKNNFNKTKKLVHNHALALDAKKKIKNYEIIATNLDKNNKEFIDIIKHKKYPFFGFQGHPEINNTKLFIPFINSVYENFNKKQLNNNLKEDNQKDKKNNKQFRFIKLKSKKVSCKKYNLAQTTKYGKCIFYKTLRKNNIDF
jgi:gamma-glutamyl-gamma-aminobutyrate hydrolase PuuD